LNRLGFPEQIAGDRPASIARAKSKSAAERARELAANLALRGREGCPRRLVAPRAALIARRSARVSLRSEALHPHSDQPIGTARELIADRSPTLPFAYLHSYVTLTEHNAFAPIGLQSQSENSGESITPALVLQSSFASFIAESRA
jgi:hypothetical protein